MSEINERQKEISKFVNRVETEFKDQIAAHWEMCLRHTYEYMYPYLKNYRKTAKYKMWERARYHEFQKASQDLTTEDRRIIKEFYRRTPYGMSVDHIIPLSKGGKHNISNLQYLSLKENVLKGNKLIGRK